MTSWDEDLIFWLVYIWQVVAELCIRSEMSHFYCFKHGMWQPDMFLCPNGGICIATLPTLRLLISTIHKNLRINRVPYKFPLFLKWVVALWSYVTFLCLAQKKWQRRDMLKPLQIKERKRLNSNSTKNIKRE